jgi:transposase-like protein
MQHVSSKTLEHYVPEEGRKVNLWGLTIQPQDFFEEVQTVSLKVVKAFFELGLEQQRDELVGASRHERSVGRSDARNGYYLRKSFQTAIGRIESLRIPRCRKQSLVKALEGQLRRTRGAVEGEVVEMFLKGLSVRSIGPILDGLLGLPISPGQVSRLARRIDHQVSAFHRGRLEDRYVYLFFDGIHLKRRSAPRIFRRMGPARRRVALVAYGITAPGVKELIGYRLEQTESESGWRRFLGSLRSRGLAGQKVRLVITDGGQGLLNALDDFYADSSRQRCWFHTLSNVLTKLRKPDRRACLSGLRKIYAASGYAQAEQAYLAWAREWKEKAASAVRSVEEDLESLLGFYAMPKAHWQMLRTTNAIERCFREVRRRTRSVGCFVNDASLERMIYGLFNFLNQKRAEKVCREFKRSEAA